MGLLGQVRARWIGRWGRHLCNQSSRAVILCLISSREEKEVKGKNPIDEKEEDEEEEGEEEEEEEKVNEVKKKGGKEE